MPDKRWKLQSVQYQASPQLHIPSSDSSRHTDKPTLLGGRLQMTNALYSTMKSRMFGSSNMRRANLGFGTGAQDLRLLAPHVYSEAAYTASEA